MLLRGPTVMTEYLHNEKATLDAFDKEGWLRARDIRRIDQSSKLYIVDHKKVSPVQHLVAKEKVNGRITHTHRTSSKSAAGKLHLLN